MMNWLTALPTLNAALNATSAVFLLSGYRFIRAKRVRPHRICMGIACVTSLVFFVSYLIYHAHVGAIRFAGHGWIRPVYFAILLSHVVLAVVIVPLVGRTLYLALTERVALHRRLARITFPLWLYVSVTGVIVYVMVYHV